jgi:MscS family membrane protein
MVAPPASSQSALTQILQPSSAPAAAKTVSDPLNRDTPSGTVFGFLQAAQSGSYQTASEYLQMSASRRQSDGAELARKLKIVMDRALAGSLKHVSNLPEGEPQDGVPRDRQHLGIMASGDAEAQLELVRVAEPGAGKIWVVASDTLEKIPEVYEQVEARRMETGLPAVLVRHQLGGMPLWQWLALLMALPFAAAAAWMLLVTLEFPRRWWTRRRGAGQPVPWRSVSAPAWLLVATALHRVWAAYLGLPLLPRHYYAQITAVALIAAANWLAWRFIRLFLRRVRMRALSRGRVGTGSVLLLGERLIKAGMFIVAVFAVLGSLGFNLTTALAGLGIGGLAIGFGAQKTIENLFGGLSVLGDEAIRVGETCRFGDRVGVIEDIGLRSTRVRTEERTLLTIPNGTMATVNLENLSRRDKFLFKTDLGLRCETLPEQLRQVLTEIRALLYSHPQVEKGTARIRFTELRPSFLNLELFCYIVTRDAQEFLAVREGLLLTILDVVERAGTGLALPSQTLYLSRDAGLGLAKSDAVAKTAAQSPPVSAP